METIKIKVETIIKAPVETVWRCWTQPEHIIHWNHASDEWHTPKAENDLREGGRFNYRMEAKDGSMGFDFNGTYLAVIQNKRLEYELNDQRKVQVVFTESEDGIKVEEEFTAENTNSAEMQKNGWQAILDNFKKYVQGI
ncbi:MAG: SRPBCC family protein [Bacteroidota bacterium]